MCLWLRQPFCIDLLPPFDLPSLDFFECQIHASALARIVSIIILELFDALLDHLTPIFFSLLLLLNILGYADTYDPPALSVHEQLLRWHPLRRPAAVLEQPHHLLS